MSQNIKNEDNQASISEIKSLLERTKFAREWTLHKPNAVSEILSLAETNPMVREIIIEDAGVSNNFALLSELAKIDEIAKQALIEFAKKGRISAIYVLENFPNDNDVNTAIVAMAKNPTIMSSVIPVVEEMLIRCKNNKALRDVILEINKDISWYGIQGIALLARSGDGEAKNRLFELGLTYYESGAINEIYYWSHIGNEEAKGVLFEIAKQGKPDAIRCVRFLAHNGDKESLDLLLELSAERTKSENDKYRICFAMRELVNLINEDTRMDKLDKKSIVKIINKLNEIGRSGDLEAQGYLRGALQNTKTYIYHLGDVYPDLEPLMEVLADKPALGISIYDPHYYDKPTIVHVTRFSANPDEKHKDR